MGKAIRHRDWNRVLKGLKRRSKDESHGSIIVTVVIVDKDQDDCICACGRQDCREEKPPARSGNGANVGDDQGQEEGDAQNVESGRIDHSLPTRLHMVAIVPVGEVGDGNGLPKQKWYVHDGHGDPAPPQRIVNECIPSCGQYQEDDGR